MKARAAVLVADRKLEIRHFDVPEEHPPGWGLLRVEGCGICGSDVEQYDGVTRAAGICEYPVIPGHEIVGRIAALDDDGRRRWGVEVGDRVAMHGTAGCGVCVQCRRGARCHTQFYYGFRSANLGSGLWGGYAEYLQLAPNATLFPMPAHLPVEDAVLFNPLAAGFDWVIKEGRTGLGDSVVICGPGQRGLASVIGAREAGAGQIIVTGLARDRDKLALARLLGATTTLVVGEDDVVDAVRDLTEGRGADRVVDTTPLATQPVIDALTFVRTGGTIVLAGLKGGRTMAGFPVDTIVHKKITVVGVLSTSAWAVDQAIRTISSGRYPLSDLHTATMPLERADLAIRMLAGEVEGESPVHLTVVPTG
ncbi:MAG TPA: alcohol dehydrogenase catalytic domain-containing protein [Amycolatopsis sp.]|nr:alcohol dehydrogenase catalytic domain-containing protein [Amycolatopsis sp.]